ANDVGGGEDGTGHTAIGMVSVDHEIGKMQGLPNLLACLFEGQAAMCAPLVQRLSEFTGQGRVVRIHDGDRIQGNLRGLRSLADGFRTADQRDGGDVVASSANTSLQDTGVGGLGEYDVFASRLCAAGQLFENIHGASPV